MNTLKVVVTVDENYVYPLKVMLHSLFSTQKDKVTVYVVHTRIREKSIGELKDFCLANGAEMVEVRMENDVFEHAPIIMQMHFTREMYYRLILPWLLPGEKRVLYLDPDIIVNGSLSYLWNMKMGGAFMTAVKDRCVGLLGTKAREYISKDAVYMNSGVLLMNLEKMRKEQSRETIQSLLVEKGKGLEFPDQDIINILYEGKMKQVEDAYNLNPNLLYLKEYLSQPLLVKRSWKIVHYMGPDKPWNSGYWGNLYYLWAKAEWHVYPEKRWRIFGRILLEPYRYLRGIFMFIKNHDWRKGFGK